jgi:hypothetical protein
MDLIFGFIFELLGECVIECAFEFVTRVLRWLGL